MENINVIPMPNKVTFFGGKKHIVKKNIEYITSSNYLEETYTLEISSNAVKIISNGRKGRFYAMNTLAQLMDEKGNAPLIRIDDRPAYSYRAFMIDSSRHMQTVDEIKKYIEAASMFKFNVFHWHLSDDQGFRIESEKYPKLNSVGSYRNGHGFGSLNEETYGGYYTKEEIRDVVKFCKARFIDVIPEIDMPGHSKAMIAAYPELSCKKEPIEVELNAGIHKDILCGGRDEVLDFCYNILEEVMELFPCKYIHIGGDEAPKDRWKACHDCQKRIEKESLKNEEELQGYFTNKIVAFLKSKGKSPIAWNESLNSGMADKDLIICDWMNKKRRCENWANNGGKLIAEDFYHFYLDYPYGMTPVKKTYSYYPELKGLTADGKKNVIGVETPIWTEYIEDFDRMSYMCFPRMMAVGELGWTDAKNRNHDSFCVRAESKRSYLKSLGINMAPNDHWNPGFSVRFRDISAHLKKAITPEVIKDALKK